MPFFHFPNSINGCRKSLKKSVFYLPKTKIIPYKTMFNSSKADLFCFMTFRCFTVTTELPSTVISGNQGENSNHE